MESDREPEATPPKHHEAVQAVRQRAEEVIDRSRNLRHLLALKRVLRNLRDRLPENPPPPPSPSH